ncbi:MULTISPECIES: helix-turn-helix domain-containing protein [Yersinia]|uniref:helix-turn-helix domain-containing protein n=1 Tax=Yersinia TaxID=629 RepID=UPI0005DA6E85|nr:MULTISPECIES: helix-turn-helix domain-containing protein [Yersinia]ATM86020.1 transcriptional regulator [Yersinia frederiksenii]MCB5316344.1 helix-turn-helix domain-containing protein [Yersinia massiliensis]CQH32932.1 phage repressor protein [Yersinia frederiksenii]
MSISIGIRIREIRDAEKLSRDEFAELTGVPAGNLKRYETERIKSVGSEFLLRITQHPRFKKYALWLMTGDVAPEIGQISPDLSPDGPESTSANQKGQKVG